MNTNRNIRYKIDSYILSTFGRIGLTIFFAGAGFAIAEAVPVQNIPSATIGLIFAVLAIQLLEVREKSVQLEVMRMYEKVRPDAWLHEHLTEALDAYLAVVEKQNFPIFHERAREAMETCRDSLVSLASGRIRVGPEREALFTISMVPKCQKLLQGVSYKDEEWWHGPFGQQYLEEHKKLLKRGGKVQRIFIIQDMHNGPALEAVNATMNTQAKMGITVHYAYESTVLPGLLSEIQDFVIYDQTVVRLSTRADPRREAILYSDPTEVRTSITRFQSLLANSSRWHSNSGHGVQLPLLANTQDVKTESQVVESIDQTTEEKEIAER
jgi:hypothetical protein